jgi:hypothetical protein
MAHAQSDFLHDEGGSPEIVPELAVTVGPFHPGGDCDQDGLPLGVHVGQEHVDARYSLIQPFIESINHCPAGDEVDGRRAKYDTPRYVKKVVMLGKAFAHRSNSSAAAAEGKGTIRAS